ncbi:monovalent cation:proton antiporter-2 (CPA2) family protein [Luteibacter sp. SG786]|uniref:monovalent cation:proton antiporter-2 (CPA2) family protein n=1 Tax=Luteibacter sp. SG786 TaxID=2587130 RepID=UPI0014245F3C|nr:glutathione-regulated potassium-efflux system protein KefB [Luteibacter sp. SG786]
MTAIANSQLLQAVALLGAAVLVVPVFRALKLGAVLGYLFAGVLVGPFVLGWFTDPEAILGLAELGVVMFLFVIGLEMRPAHLWALRGTIYGLGLCQLVACGAALTAVAWALGAAPRVAFVGAMGFVLTSTAIVMQLLSESGELSRPAGQKVVAILLLEDLIIVPLLALVAWMAPAHESSATGIPWLAAITGLGCLLALLAAGRWLLEPLFRVLARSRVREVLSAGALLVVLGAALLMQLGGLSMALGAFLAGVLLSQSSFRHQLEADIEPFRGLLLGLFFLGIGMALDLHMVREHLLFVLLGVVAMMLAKALAIYAVGRALGDSHADAMDRALLMPMGGEFAFVLYAGAAASGLMSQEDNARFTAIVVLSMALAPLLSAAVHRLIPKAARPVLPADVPPCLTGSILMIGFGRFGQVVSQSLLARDIDVTVIDTDVEMVQAASDFGFKIYYGDGTRLDVLEAAGADKAQVIAICVDSRSVADTIVDIGKESFPNATLMVRTYDREHALRMVAQGVPVHVRETFESALRFGSMALVQLGATPTEAEAIADLVRRRDAERFARELEGIDWATAGLANFKRPRPVPWTTPTHQPHPSDTLR